MSRRLSQEIDLETGVIVTEIYRKGYVRHRDPEEGPAEIRRDAATGVVVYEEYRRGGQLHREDGPAIVARNASTGIVVREGYYRHGLLHREPKEGPAEKIWDDTGRIVVAEMYYLYHAPYRDPADGPRCIRRNEKTGAIKSQQYDRPGVTRPEDPRAWRRKAGGGGVPSP